MNPIPELSTNTVVSSNAPSYRTSRLHLTLASLAILLPCVLAAMTSLPLPVRGVSAIVGGLTMLLCGCYLLGQAFAEMARHTATNPA